MLLSAIAKCSWGGNAVSGGVVVSLDHYRSQHLGTGSVSEENPRENSYVHISPVSALQTREGQLATAAELYPDLKDSDSVLSKAMTLLQEADGILNDAATCAAGEEMVAADDAVQRFSALLPELFVCRSLGDSFATVVLALFHGFANLGGMPATAGHISGARTCVRSLLREPFLQYHDALGLVSKLEGCGMVVEPASLSTIGEVLLG